MNVTKGVIHDCLQLSKEKVKKSEQYWGQRQNGWAGAVIVGRGGNARR